MDDIIPKTPGKSNSGRQLAPYFQWDSWEFPVRPGLNMIFDQLRVFGGPDFLAAYIDEFRVVRLE